MMRVNRTLPVTAIVIVVGCILGCIHGNTTPQTATAETIFDPPELTQKKIQNGLGMTFVRIAPGTFTMGSPPTEVGRLEDEDPKSVTIDQPFYIQTTEVTQAQWNMVMDYAPSYFNTCGADCPVEYVSWDDAQEFISRLNEKAGRNLYRLPTEAEWEYACRAGSTGRFYFGDDDSKLNDYAWYENNADSKPHKVASKKPNAWGLYDMHGNVFEWCEEWYKGKRASIVPRGRHFTPKPARKLRGGCWDDKAVDCRSASRSFCEPGIANMYIGVRLVISP